MDSGCSMQTTKQIKEFFEACIKTTTEDLDRCVNFWLKHSHDEIYGGFFTCIRDNGKVYDTTKYVWLQGRQIWTYARLYNELPRFRRQDILNAAIKGADFMMKYSKTKATMKCYFALTREGKPIKIQRTIFSEIFYLLGMSEIAKATGNKVYENEAEIMMECIKYWVLCDDSEIGRPLLEGNTQVHSLAVPMMTLYAVLEISKLHARYRNLHADLLTWSIESIKMHVQREGTLVLENVYNVGEEMPGSSGRLLNPGHAIEAGWFLLKEALQTRNEDLRNLAITKFILNPFDYGWDKKYGGLFYFLDADGHTPTQLEWSMKLWWPHNEALVSLLMAYKETNDPTILERYRLVFNYSYEHFCDTKNGEWHGYLNQQGEPLMNFKGGPYKGFFHVPRCLLMSEKLITDILKDMNKEEAI